MADNLDDMLEYDLKRRGVTDARTLDAMRAVDRKAFVPQLDKARAYEDRALVLGCGQTLSQPYMVAQMTQSLALTGRERVLEIGTGSGYQTAILSKLTREVYTVERIEYLATTAEDRLLEMGCANVRFRLGDGSLGWPQHAPYDRIIVTAACPKIPPSLAAQLIEGGILVAPVGPPDGQELIVAHKMNGELVARNTMACIFVRLIGSEGYGSDAESAR